MDHAANDESLCVQEHQLRNEEGVHGLQCFRQEWTESSNLEANAAVPDTLHNSNDPGPEHEESSRGKTYLTINTAEGPEYRCSVPGCTYNKGFKRPYDLKRHQLKHSSTPPRWSCGCCKNIYPTEYYNTQRKDHLMQHMRKKHHSANTYLCQICKADSGSEIYFSGKTCLDVHLSRDHPQQSLKGNLPHQPLDNAMERGGYIELNHLP